MLENCIASFTGVSNSNNLNLKGSIFNNQKFQELEHWKEIFDFGVAENIGNWVGPI